MTASTQVRIGLVLLLVVQVLTSFAGVLLLARMGPAVGGITGRASRALQFAEHASFHLDQGDAEAYEEDLAAFRAVATDEDAAILTGIDADRRDAFAGDADARRALREGWFRIQESEHLHMEERDATVHRLAYTGAWVMVILGLGGYLANVWVTRRFRVSLLAPLMSAADTLRAVMQGDQRRRCAVQQEVAELRDLAVGINRLLDQQGTAICPASPVPHRAALLAVMDLHPLPVVVTGARGEILAASLSAQDLLAGPEGPQVRQALEEATPERIERRATLPDGGAVSVMKG